MNRNLMLAAAALLTATSAMAADPATPAESTGPDIAAGKAKASTICVACHGLTGKSIMPIYPNLTGQNEAYLISSMKAYRADERKGGQSAVMTPMAKMLSDADIINLAAYYSSQK